MPERTTLLVTIAALLCALTTARAEVDAIAELRLAGELGQARLAAESALPTAASAAERVALHLELARIHDRIGLHRNSRPVMQALHHIEMAAAEQGGREAYAQVELALADWHYRAEMAGREFPVAERHALRAIEAFHGLGDRHGEAEAVHRLGLIEMQRRNLERAGELFDRSLVLDIEGGARTFFLGEYERHTGFVHLLAGDPETAIPFFERSLAARREAGATDAALFAASSLASALVSVGRPDDALAHADYALRVAQTIDSPVGAARAGLVRGRALAAIGEAEAARTALATAIGQARSVDYASLVAQAEALLVEIGD